MAGINARINLVDALSGPMQRMIASTENLINHINNVESAMDSGFEPSVIEEARHQAEVLSNQMNTVSNSINNAENEQQSFNNTVNGGTSAMGGLVAKAIALTSAYMGAGKLVNMSDEITQAAARLDMMNDKAQTTPELFNMVYQSAQNARGSLTDMVDVVARFGNNAKDAFGSSREVVDFTNLIQKQMTIAGAGTQEASNAMLQLSQALGSGVLRGDELNSIFEQAPNLIQSIADYMDVPIGSIKQMAQEGKLSADIVKNAIFADADNINAKFEQMPMTWGQVWTTMSNAAIMQLQPLLEKINSIANSPQFQAFASNAVNAVGLISNALIGLIDLIGNVASFVSDNWGMIEPVVMGIVTALVAYNTVMAITNVLNTISAIRAGVKAAADAMQAGATFAATAAQYGLNSALLACPLTWIVLAIMAVIVVIYAVVAAINKVTGSTISVTGIITGLIATAAAFVGNVLLGLVNFVIGLFVEITNLLITFANFFGNILDDPVSAIAHLFSGLFDFIFGVVQSAAGLIDTLLGTDLSGGIQGFRNDVAAFVDEKVGKQKYEADKINANDYKLKRFEYSKAWDAGYGFGEGIENKAKGMFGTAGSGNVDTANAFGGGGYSAGSHVPSGYDSVPNDIANTAKNTKKSADSLDITNEDLQYLRDIAERDVINRFTTAEIKVDMKNNNNISSSTDLDGLISDLTDKVTGALNMAAEGVHR